jgi:hypothetical protein
VDECGEAIAQLVAYDRQLVEMEHNAQPTQHSLDEIVGTLPWPPRPWLEPVIHRYVVRLPYLKIPPAYMKIPPAIARVRGSSFPRRAWRWLAQGHRPRCRGCRDEASTTSHDAACDRAYWHIDG